VPVPGAGPVGDGFDRQGLVVAAVEGELPGGLVGRAKGVGAQRDAAENQQLRQSAGKDGVVRALPVQQRPPAR
jgi:hypothetical protein